MIDSMLDDDSPVSCDPAHSRDVYQVAIDELTNGGQTGSFNPVSYTHLDVYKRQVRTRGRG